MIRSIERLLRAFILGLLCCVVVTLWACVGTRILRPSSEIDEAGFREHVRALSSDEFAGHEPTSAGEEKTIAYLVEHLRKLGLKPGNGASYLQAVPLAEVRVAAGVSLSVSGRDGVYPLSYAKDVVIWSRREVAEARLAHSELVFVGYGIVAPEYAWNDYAQTDVRGKTVVVLINDPGVATKHPKVFKGGVMTSYGLWSYKIEEAGRHGASGVLLVHDADAAAIAWNAVVNTWTGPQLRTPGTEGNASLPVIEGWMSLTATRALFVRAGLDFAVLSTAAARSGFKSLPMGLVVDAQLHNSIRAVTYSNVIALLPGGRRGHEYVMFTAHWDHFFNGAIDNASGTAGLLMLAQSFSRTLPSPDRSMVFLALAGEEPGLLGSQYYADNPIFPLGDTAGVINLDSLHIGGPTRDVSVFGNGNSELEGLLRDAAILQGRELHSDPSPGQGQYFCSAQFSFAKKGVPALYAKGGIDDAARGAPWGRAQLADFTTQRYRQATDQYSPDWDVRGTLDDLRLYYDVGNQLAHSRRFPDWYPNSEFRASHGHGGP